MLKRVKIDNLFFLESPLQVDNAVIVQKKLGGNSCFILRDNGDAKSLEIMRSKTILFSEDMSVMVKHVKLPSKGVFKIFYLANIIALMLLSYEVERVVYGDPRSVVRQILRNFLGNKVGCIDDGAYTFVAIKEINEGRMSGIDFWYTRFRGLKSDKIDVICFPYVGDDVDIRDGEVWIAGMPLVEKGLLLAEEYLAAIDYMRKALSAIGLNKVLYVPHRAEIKYKDFCLEGIEVIRLDSSIESYIESTKSAPKAVVSFYSTVLFSVSEMFPLVDVYYVDLLSLGLGNDRLHKATPVYNALKCRQDICRL